jgi:hypothetical protein
LVVDELRLRFLERVHFGFEASPTNICISKTTVRLVKTYVRRFGAQSDRGTRGAAVNVFHRRKEHARGYFDRFFADAINLPNQVAQHSVFSLFAGEGQGLAHGMGFNLARKELVFGAVETERVVIQAATLEKSSTGRPAARLVAKAAWKEVRLARLCQRHHGSLERAWNECI